jgi:hypothetical protein
MIIANGPKYQNLAQYEQFRADALELEDGSFFAGLARQWLDIAAFEMARGLPLAAAATALRKGIDELRISLELGYLPAADHGLKFFCAALVVDDKSFAHWIASLSGFLPRGSECINVIAQIVCAIVRHERHLAQQGIDELSTLIGSDASFDEWTQIRPLDGTHRLLNSIINRDSFHFCEEFSMRSKSICADDRIGRLRHLDLFGLALCRLAAIEGLSLIGPSMLIQEFNRM